MITKQKEFLITKKKHKKKSNIKKRSKKQGHKRKQLKNKDVICIVF